MTPEKLEIVHEALAHYFGCEVSEIAVTAIVCERRTSETTSVSYITAGATHWQLIGLVEELKAYLEHERSGFIMNMEMARIV